ncbi:MAG TPA: hypothetical protein VGE98_01760, partial [Thermoanaerobaculia bacterium]
VDFAVDLHHQGAIPRAVVTLALNGREVLRQTVPLQGQPPVVTLRGQWEVEPGRWLSGEVSAAAEGGEADALPADDKSAFVLPPVEEGKVALLARSFYLRAALSPEIARGRWQVEALDPAGKLPSQLGDVLVLEADQAQSTEVRDLLLRYLNNGRGVLLLVNRSTPLVKGFLRELGFAVDERPAPASAEGAGEGFRFVATRHPIFAPFASGELGDLLTTRVHRHVRLASPSAQPLLYGTSGDPLLFENTGTEGRLLVLAFGWDRDDTDWPIAPTFLPFLDLALQHARAAVPVVTAAEPGTLWTWTVPPGVAAHEVALARQGHVVARAAVDASHHAALPVPDGPGLYDVLYDGQGPVVGRIAVDPPIAESDLSYVRDPAALSAWRIAAPPRAAKAAPLALPGAESAFRSLVWWWLLLAGAALLAAEMLSLVGRKEAV